MPAPINNYVINSGSVYRIYDKSFDLELVTFVDNIKFAGSGSLRPSSFDIIIEGRPLTITNQYQIDRLDIRKYLFPVSGQPYEYYYDYVSASLDLFRDFNGRYNALLNSFNSIKGYLAATSSNSSSGYFPYVPPVA